MLKRVPFEQMPWSSFATEFAEAVGPCVSNPAEGETPSATGLNAYLPSGVAPVCAPSGTFAETG